MEKRRLRGNLITVYKYLKNCHVGKRLVVYAPRGRSDRKSSPQQNEGLSNKTRRTLELSKMEWALWEMGCSDHGGRTGSSVMPCTRKSRERWLAELHEF